MHISDSYPFKSLTFSSPQHPQAYQAPIKPVINTGNQVPDVEVSWASHTRRNIAALPRGMRVLTTI